MKSSEAKKQKLVAQLVAAAQKVVGENRISKANYVVVPAKNIEAIAKEFNITIEEVEQLINNYFANKLN